MSEADHKTIEFRPVDLSQVGDRAAALRRFSGSFMWSIIARKSRMICSRELLSNA
jgi:hypothetical protein